MFNIFRKRQGDVVVESEVQADSTEQNAGLSRAREEHLRRIYGDKAAQVRAARRAAEARKGRQC